MCNLKHVKNEGENMSNLIALADVLGVENKIRDLELAKKLEDNPYIIKQLDILIDVFQKVCEQTVTTDELLEGYKTQKAIIESQQNYGYTEQKRIALESSSLVTAFYIDALTGEKEELQKFVESVETTVAIKNSREGTSDISVKSEVKFKSEEESQSILDGSDSSNDKEEDSNQNKERFFENDTRKSNKKKVAPLNIDFKKRIEGAKWIDENVTTNYSAFSISTELKDYFTDLRSLPIGEYSIIINTEKNIEGNKRLSNRVTSRLIEIINGYRSILEIPLIEVKENFSQEEKNIFNELYQESEDERQLIKLFSLGEDIRSQGLADYFFRQLIMTDDFLLEHAKKINFHLYIKKYKNATSKTIKSTLNEYYLVYTIESD